MTDRERRSELRQIQKELRSLNRDNQNPVDNQEWGRSIAGLTANLVSGTSNLVTGILNPNAPV